MPLLKRRSPFDAPFFNTATGPEFPAHPLKVALWREHNSHHLKCLPLDTSGYSGDRLPFFLG
jgi:hypothetical protein